MEVKIISHKFIKPSKPTPQRLQNLTISFIDQLLPPRTVPLVYYYLPHENINQTLPNLEKALSDVLTLYYPIAGRYIKEDNLIKCNDKGIEYFQVLVNGPISQILQSGSIEPKDLNPFAPDEEQESETTPLLKIQVSVFSCGGIAIGLRIGHRIIDGFTYLSFTKAWAKTCKDGHIGNVSVPCFAAGTLFPPKDIPTVISPALKIASKRLFFDMETISKLKEEVKRSRSSRNSIITIPTTSEILMAVLWRAQTNSAKQRKQGKQSTSLLQTLLNLRGKMFKTIPENCCGNLVVSITAKLEEDGKRMGLVDYVEQVRIAIRKWKMEFARAMEDGGDVLYRKVMEAKMVSAGMGKGDDVVVSYFSSLVNFPLYEGDFGWGKPVWLSMPHRDNLGTLFTERKDGDGVDVWLHVAEEEMKWLEIEQDLIRLTKHVAVVGNGGDPISFSRM